MCSTRPHAAAATTCTSAQPPWAGGGVATCNNNNMHLAVHPQLQQLLVRFVAGQLDFWCPSSQNTRLRPTTPPTRQPAGNAVNSCIEMQTTNSLLHATAAPFHSNSNTHKPPPPPTAAAGTPPRGLSAPAPVPAAVQPYNVKQRHTCVRDAQGALTLRPSEACCCAAARCWSLLLLHRCCHLLLLPC